MKLYLKPIERLLLSESISLNLYATESEYLFIVCSNIGVNVVPVPSGYWSVVFGISPKLRPELNSWLKLRPKLKSW